MRENIREILYVIVLIALSTVIGKVVWLLPFIIFVPLVLTYSIDSPLVYLAPLAIYAELYSVTQPGIGSLVVFIPYIIKKLWRGQVDFGTIFIGVVALTAVIQTFVLFLPDVLAASSFSAMPWLVIAPMFIITTTAAFLSIIAVHYNRSW